MITEPESAIIHFDNKPKSGFRAHHIFILFLFAV